MIDAQERVAAKRGLRTTLYCEVCGKEIPNRPDRKTATCLKEALNGRSKAA